MKISVVVSAALAVCAGAASAEWAQLPQSGYWPRMLHLGADFFNDHLAVGAGVGADQLAAFGGEAAQRPFPGLVYQALPASVGGARDFVWTAMDNPAATPGAVWSPNKDNYIKYWHIYIWSPDAAERPARLLYRCDDDLYVWNNGVRVLARTGWDGDAEQGADITLAPGLNSFTVKLREGASGDRMGVRLAAPDGSAFTDLLYSTGPLLGARDAHEISSLTHESVTLSEPVEGENAGGAFTVHVVCDAEDRGGALSNWLASASCESMTLADITAAPASATLAGLSRDTDYIGRVFVEQGGVADASGPFAFRTRGALPAVEALPATDVSGLSATANINLAWQGADSATADVTLYWGENDGGEDPAAWAALNPARAPVAVGAMAPGSAAIPLTDLWYTTLYHYRAFASNADGSAWSSGAAQFTTQGEPYFNAISAAVPAPGSLTVTADIGSSGPAGADVSVTCWFGASAGALTQAAEWAAAGGPAAFSHTVSGLQVGGEYWYAFRIDAEVDADTAWTVWSATNSFVTAGVATWTALGADTDWHTAANWDAGVPGSGATANFHAAGATVTGLSDLAVDRAVVNDSGEIVFNFGGSTLSAPGGFMAGGGAPAGWLAENGSVLRLSGGVIDLGADGDFFIGNMQNDNRVVMEGASEIIADELTVGFSSGNPALGQRNSLSVSGPAKLSVKTLRLSGGSKSSGNTFLLQNAVMTNSVFNIGDGGEQNSDAATLSNSTAVAGALNIAVNGWRTQSHVLRLLDSRMEVTGSVGLGQSDAPPGSKLAVTNSVMTVGGNFNTGTMNSNAMNNELLIHADPGRESRVSVNGQFILGGPTNRVLITGGTLEANELLFGSWSGQCQHLVNSNGAVAVNGFVRIGNQNARAAFMRMSGDDARFNAATLEIGSANNSGDDSSFRIDGGLAQVSVATRIGKGTNTARFTAGAASSRFETAALSVADGSALEFEIPEEGFAQTPLFVSGAAALGAQARVAVRATGFTGKAILMESAQLAEPLPEENYEFDIPPGFQATVLEIADCIAVRITQPMTLMLLR